MGILMAPTIEGCVVTAMLQSRGDGLLHFFASLDRWLFRLLNESVANPVLDVVMPFITEKNHFLAVLVVIWLILFWKANRKGRLVALGTLVVIAASDQLSAQVIKPLFGRPRPPYTLESVRLLVHTTTSFSFPSAHAANAFAVASFVSSFYPATRIYLYSVAVLLAYSRIYVGVHYPGDALGGAILGLAIGLGSALALRRLPGLVSPVPAPSGPAGS